MMKHSSSRNQRSRGWKVKHVLQICVLVAVCVWLLYQVKHSYDKKKALEERSFKPSNSLEDNGAGFLKFGRKDPRRSNVVTDTDNTTGNEEEADKEAGGTAEQGNREEENEGEGGGAGGNETEESDEESIYEEAEGGEEFGDEEKEGQFDDLGSSDNQDHEGADGKSQEAREEHYKADDASSAVVRDTQEIDHEIENLLIENSDERKGTVEKEELENVGRTNETEDASKYGENVDIENSDEQKNTEKEELENDGRNNGTADAFTDSELPDVTVNGESQLYNRTSFMEVPVVEKEAEVGYLLNSTATVESASQIEERSNTTSNAVDLREQHNISAILESNDQIEQQNSSTGALSDEQRERQNMSEGVNAETLDSAPENTTVSLDSAQGQITVNETPSLREDNSSSENISLEQAEKSVLTGAVNVQIEQQHNSTTTVTEDQGEAHVVSGGAAAETADSTADSATATLVSAENQSPLNETRALTEDHSILDNISLEQTQKSDPSGAAAESDESPKTSSVTDEDGEAVQGESVASSSHVVSVSEERDVQTNLSTLPEVQTEPVEGIAAE